jgi:superfamily II DNA or RNA helicase
MISVSKINELYLRVDANRDILLEIFDLFSFYADGYKYMPSYKAGTWDGRVRLFNLKQQKLAIGLLAQLFRFLQSTKIEFNIDPSLLKLVNFNKEIEEFVKTIPNISTLNPTGKYQFQSDLFQQALKLNRALILSPTGSGKSHIIYFFVRFLLKYTDQSILIVVPTVSLVMQLESDFATYANDGFSVSKNVHRIYAGQPKNPGNKRIVITTWASARVQPPEWFDRFGSFICDEAHQADTQSITTILNNIPNLKFKFGLTGTIENTKSHKLVLSGWFGSIISSLRTKKLMDSGVLSELAIEAKIIDYSEKDRKNAWSSFKSYQDEIKWLVHNKSRNEFIVDLAFKEPKNTLVLFNLVEGHGHILYDIAVERTQGTNKKVFFIHGGVKAEEREYIRKTVEHSEGNIIFASYGVFSVGTNLKNLHVVIFAHPYKSKIKNLQSIGRVLRTNFNKSSAKLVDIADDLSYNSKHNITFTHYLQRLKIYHDERFTHTTETIRFKED